MTQRPPSNGVDPSGAGRRDENFACRQWEAELVEAARSSAHSGSAQPASPRAAAALEHAGHCPACRERLAAERALCDDLSQLAGADSDSLPSAGCEAIVLAAFRTEREPERESRAPRWIFAVAGTLAVALLALIGAALVVSRDSGSLAHAVLSRLPQLGARRAAALPALGSGAQTVAEDDSFAGANEGEEEVTDFYAFYPGADISSLDSGALVRVRVPSSEMGAFGLQVAQGREEEWISADLLVAEDGSPQAIRFVLPAPQESRN